MKISEVIQRVQSLYSKGVESDDSRLTRRHIYNKLVTIRSTLLFNKLNKKQNVSVFNYNTLPCVELVKVEAHECPCVPPSGCQILRSKYKLPSPINTLSGHYIDSVTSLDGQIQFDETTWKGKKWRSGDKYTSRRPDWFIKDDYLYITVTRRLQAVTIIALFEDPVEAAQFPSLCEQDCEDCCPINPMEVDFNMDNDLLDTLVEMSVKELIGVFNQNKEDITNNSQDEKQPSK